MKKLLLIFMSLFLLLNESYSQEIRDQNSPINLKESVSKRISELGLKLKWKVSEDFYISYLDEQSFNQAPLGMYLYALTVKMKFLNATTTNSQQINFNSILCGDTIYVFESNKDVDIAKELRNGSLKECTIVSPYAN